jgi:hypothetical protein
MAPLRPERSRGARIKTADRKAVKENSDGVGARPIARSRARLRASSARPIGHPTLNPNWTPNRPLQIGHPTVYTPECRSGCLIVLDIDGTPRIHPFGGLHFPPIHHLDTHEIGATSEACEYVGARPVWMSKTLSFGHPRIGATSKSLRVCGCPNSCGCPKLWSGVLVSGEDVFRDARRPIPKREAQPAVRVSCDKVN